MHKNIKKKNGFATRHGTSFDFEVAKKTMKNM